MHRGLASATCADSAAHRTHSDSFGDGWGHPSALQAFPSELWTRPPGAAQPGSLPEALGRVPLPGRRQLPKWYRGAQRVPGQRLSLRHQPAILEGSPGVMGQADKNKRPPSNLICLRTPSCSWSGRLNREWEEVEGGCPPLPQPHPLPPPRPPPQPHSRAQIKVKPE